MIRTIVLALAATFALSAPAHAQQEWKWGVNFYDLQLHSAVSDDSEVVADICSAAFIATAAFLQDEDGSPDTIHQLATFGKAWTEEGANRRGVELEAYKSTYMIPAFILMQKLDIDHLQYWNEYCLKLTQRSVEQRSE
ncbi:MAG: hypothetical protein EON93_13535 [Burkholderiales bacterium]|nr:MAG: hypothetical protein EON93_13535 [Burkholderiales bacterium]